VRIHHGWTVAGDWPRFAMVRALVGQMPYLDSVVYDRPHIKVKTLVLGGEKDSPDFPARPKRIADTIPGAELVLLPNLGHVPHFEAPDLFHAALLKFLKAASEETWRAVSSTALSPSRAPFPKRAGPRGRPDETTRRSRGGTDVRETDPAADVVIEAQ